MSNSKFRKSIHSKVHQSIRDHLVNRRKELGLSQRDLAKELNVTHSLIGKIETGDRRLDIVEMVQYCNILQLEIDNITALINSSLDSK